jgi:hypothetical protein
MCPQPNTIRIIRLSAYQTNPAKKRLYENFASGLSGFGVLIDLEVDENRGVKK